MGCLTCAVQHSLATASLQLVGVRNVRVLIVANDFPRRRVERLTDFVWPDFARGKLSLLDLPSDYRRD
jgi:hypothetical protein